MYVLGQEQIHDSIDRYIYTRTLVRSAISNKNNWILTAVDISNNALY